VLAEDAVAKDNSGRGEAGSSMPGVGIATKGRGGGGIVHIPLHDSGVEKVPSSGGGVGMSVISVVQ